MFRRLMMFALLTLVLVGGFVTPAQAQDDQPIDMLEGVVLAPDGAYDIQVHVLVTCGTPGVNPPDYSHQGYLEIETQRMSPFATGTDSINWYTNSGQWDWYTKYITNNYSGEHRARWRDTRFSDLPGGGWSVWQYRTAPGQSLQFSFYYHDGTTGWSCP